MAIEKIKKASTLTGLIIVLVLVLGFFMAGYTWINGNFNAANMQIDQKYNATFGNLSETQTDLDNNIKAIRDNLNNITEADSTWQVAWNGLKGLGNTLKLPLSFLTTSISTAEKINAPLDFIPLWIKLLVITLITSVIVLLIASLLKGDPRL